MSSILRSSKFVRYFMGLARNVVISTPREVDGSLVQRSQCLASISTNNYATIAAQSQKNSLDKSIKRLDEDARKIGRISRKEIEEVLDEIRLSKRATSSQSLMVIRCCGNLVPEEAPELRTTLVKQVWKTLEKLGVSMDISHYNALLRVYLENEHRFSPTQFLTELETKGVEPNRVTYQRLIAGFCQQGDINGATRILEHMREKQLPVSEAVFNALILGHSQADDLESAHGILGVMKQAGLEPSNDTYTTLLCGYAKKGEIEAIEKLFEECQTKDIFLMDKDILEIVFTLGVNKHSDLVDKILPRVKNLLGYNQDAANVILRLINKGDDETAMKVFKTMQLTTRLNGQTVYAGSFMIKQMVKVNMPIEKTISVCKQLYDEGLNNQSFPIAVQATFTVNNIKQTLALIQALADNNFPVRVHYFWPLLIATGKAGDTNGLKTILNSMTNVFHVVPSTETIKEYILPYVRNKSPEYLMDLLVEGGVKQGTAAGAIISYLISNNKLKDAANLALENNFIKFDYAIGIKSLLSAFLINKDLDSFVTLVRAFVSSIDKNKTLAQNAEEEEMDGEADGNSGLTSEEVMGKFVLDLAKRNIPDFVKVLEAFLEHGLAISSSCAQLAENSLNSENLTEEVSALLAKLSSGEIVAGPFKRQYTSGNKPSISKNRMALEGLKEKLIAKGEPIDGVLRQLLGLHCFNKDIESLMQVKAEMIANNIELAPSQLAQIMDTFVNVEELDKAMELYQEAKANSDFKLDKIKAVKLASLLVKNERIDDALEVLEFNSFTGEKELNYVVNSISWRMLNGLAEKKNVDDVKQVLNCLVKNNFVEINNVLLGPIMKAHILNNNIEAALEEFERCCELYRATPWKNELMCKLIQAEDATNLQRLTDLSTQIHGEVNSLYDLVLAFVECGRVRQARKILETPGLRAREDRINFACERYMNDGLVAPLENLLEVTKDLTHIDRSNIFYQLLLSYKKTNDVDKALGLWTKMQEEDVPVSEEFLSTLGNFLESNNREVPFVVPNVSVSTQLKEEKTFKSDRKPKTINKDKEAFLLALQNQDIDRALEAKAQMEKAGEILNKIERTRLLEGLMKANRINDAMKLLNSWLPDRPPTLSVLKFFSNKLFQTGDVEAFDQFGELLNDELKKAISFENKRVNCVLAAGKGLDELKHWEKKIQSATTPEEIDRVCETFPRGGMLGILEKYPESIPQYEKLSEDLNAKGSVIAVNILFIHYVVNLEIKKAKAVFDKYLSNASRLMFQSVLNKAKFDNNPQIILQFKQIVENSPAMTPGAIGYVYSALIGLSCSNKNYDEALMYLEEGLKVCSLENITHASLFKLKSGLEENGQTFKYTIPRKTSKDQSSSSSSDDERKV